jgi:hypothetical protein
VDSLLLDELRDRLHAVEVTALSAETLLLQQENTALRAQLAGAERAGNRQAPPLPAASAKPIPQSRAGGAARAALPGAPSRPKGISSPLSPCPPVPSAPGR